MNCGDSTIDGLLARDASIKPLASGANAAAVGHLHDLLRGHGFVYLPDARAPYYCAFGSATRRAIGDYRGRSGLPAGDRADSDFLHDVVSRPAPKAAVGPAYVPLVLDMEFGAIHRFVWLTSLFETGGAFETINLNTDECGLSFGILQWSQKAGQLHQVLRACHDRAPAEWTRIMRDSAILDYTARPNGGVDPQGFAIDPAFELTKDPWKSRFEALGASQPMQRVQLDLAAEVYRAELGHAAGYATAISSERGFAFLLDVANQFGATRVERQYKDAARPGAGEPEILKSMEDAFTALAQPRFQPQVRARREFFRTTTLLTDEPLII